MNRADQNDSERHVEDGEHSERHGDVVNLGVEAVHRVLYRTHHLTGLPRGHRVQHHQTQGNQLQYHITPSEEHKLTYKDFI